MTKVLERIRSRIPPFKKRMMEISFDISAQIFDYMKKEKNMSQKELAKRLNKKESEVSKWLSGGHNFTIETIAKIEEVFNQKILIVPMFAQEDLGIKYSNPTTITLYIAPTQIVDKVFLYSLNNNNMLKYLRSNDKIYNTIQ